MKKRALLILIFLLLIAIIVILISFIFRKDHDDSKIILYGNVDVRQVDIGFRVSGQVDKLFFEEGDEIRKGTLLCTLDKTPYDSKLQEAIANARAVEANLKLAQILLGRRLDLLPVGGVSQEDVDDAEAKRDQLFASLEQSYAAISVAQDNLAYTESYAPNDGIILTRVREPGTVINPTDPIYTLSLTDPVWVRAFVSEPNLGKIYYGMPATVYTDSGGEYDGKIGFISPVAEFTPKTVETVQLRTDLVYRLRVYVDNPDHGLLQGMPVTVHLKK